MPTCTFRWTPAHSASSVIDRSLEGNEPTQIGKMEEQRLIGPSKHEYIITQTHISVLTCSRNKDKLPVYRTC